MACAWKIALLLLSVATAEMVAQEPSGQQVGLIYDEVYLRHDTGAGHPERAARLTAIMERLTSSGLLPRLTRLELADDGEEWITSVHPAAYRERVRDGVARGLPYLDSRDVPLSPDSYVAAVAAVNGVLAAGEAVMTGQVRHAFCAIRPPGHHALAEQAMGFCLFNNVAILARYLQRRHGLRRILIIDWDVHHGNGTQDVFYEDPGVLFFSIHQHPFYPGTGRAAETGRGAGAGSTLNVPLAAGAGDREYVQVFRERLVPAADAFKPEFVLISAGFDAVAGDSLGGMRVTPAGFAQLTRIALDIARRHAHGRLVSVLEGGYNLDQLAACVELHLRTLLEESPAGAVAEEMTNTSAPPAAAEGVGSRRTDAAPAPAGQPTE